MCMSMLGNVQHPVRYKENAAYPQALIICPENNHAEITYGSGRPLSHTLIPIQACSCWNNELCSAQLKMFGKAQAESDQGKAGVEAIPVFSKSPGGVMVMVIQTARCAC